MKVKEYVETNTISNQEYEFIMEIVKLRMNENITQKQLADLTGIPQPNIARFEKNTHSSSLSTILKILNSLGYELKIEKMKTSKVSK